MFLNIIYTLWCAQTSGELFDKISMNIMKAHNTFTSTHTPFSAPPSHPETLGLCCLFLTFYLLNYIICMSVFGLFQSAYYSETYIYCLSISNWFLPFFFFLYEQAQFNSVQPLSRVQLFVTQWTSARQASLSITNSQNLLKLMSFKSVMLSNHLILSVVPFSSHLQSFPASGSFQMSQLFASVGQSIGVSASASVDPMNIRD